jgi:hypothetical protein
MAKVEVLTRKDVRDLSVVGGGLEILDWVMYDTLTIANAGTQAEFKFFQQAVGPQGITLDTTNMDLPGQLSNGFKLIAQKLVVQPILTAMTLVAVRDAYEVSHKGYATFYIGTREYLRLPIVDLLGGGFNGFAAVAVPDAGPKDELAYVMPRTVINGELEYSPAIPSTFTFSMVLTYPAAPVVAASMKVRCSIVGKLIRPRQG